MTMKQWSEILKNISMLTQFGLSLITPILLCLFICFLLCKYTGVGGWVYILGFFFGLGGSGTVAWRFYQMSDRQEKRREKDRKDHISFNSHV